MCRILGVLMLMIFMLLGLVQPWTLAHEGHSHPSHPAVPVGSSNQALTAFAQAMDAAMEKMMTEMHRPGMTGNFDVDFLAMMIPHHAGAVEMARLVLMYGEDPLVRQLGEEIIASQQVEIAAMQARLPILKQGANFNPDGFPAMSGLRGSS